MAEQADQGEREPLLTAFGLIAEVGWRAFTMTDLAQHMGRTLAELYRDVPSRHALLHRLGRYADRVMLAVDPKELENLSPRERLFELVMRRLDALSPFRDGLRRLSRDARQDPAALLVAYCGLRRSTEWLADAAGLRFALPLRPLALRVLGAAYLAVFRTWIEDDSADKSATLAELDRRLGQLDRMAGFAQRFGRRPPGAAGA